MSSNVIYQSLEERAIFQAVYSWSPLKVMWEAQWFVLCNLIYTQETLALAGGSSMAELGS
jgi:hypothetical protein